MMNIRSNNSYDGDVEKRLAALEKRISHIEDFEAIRGLIATYAYAIDAGDFDRLMSIYLADTHFIIDAFQVDVKSSEAIRATLMSLSQGYRNMSHKIFNIDIDPKNGNGRAYFILTGIDVSLNKRVIGEGDYRYEFTKLDGQWRISEQIIHIAYLSPTSWALELPTST